MRPLYVKDVCVQFASRLTITLLVCLMILIANPALAIEIYAHRGAAGIIAENSLPGLDTALKIGVDVIDMDIGITKDGVVVLHHDMALNPQLTRSNGQYIQEPLPIHQIPFSSLSTYDVGAILPNSDYQTHFPLQIPLDNVKIPSLKEAIKFVKARAKDAVRYQIEIKSDPTDLDNSPQPEIIVPALVTVLKEENISHLAEVHSFDWRNLYLLKKLAPEVSVSFLSDNGVHFSDQMLAWTGGVDLSPFNHSFPRIVHTLQGDVWCPNFKELTKEQVNEAKALNLKVTPWTVDHPKDMITMIEYGVDGIITNRPDILRGILAAKGFEVPQHF